MNSVDWKSLTAKQQKFILARPLQDMALQMAGASEIIQQVRETGDASLRTFTQKFDGVWLDDLAVSDAEFVAAKLQVSDEIKAALTMAKQNIAAFHQAQLPTPISVATMPGVCCEYVYRPIQTVGLYVPGGTAPLVSSVLMLAVPTMLAQNPRVIICTPPRCDGSIDPAILYAAKLCGITEIYKVGGAQAIAAMAYGTTSVPSVDKIFGPGNAWVMAAKQLVAQDPMAAAVDMPAGPSEVMVIADSSADAAIVASDLLSQAEHDLQSQVLLVSTSRPLLAQVQTEINRQLVDLPRASIAKASINNSTAIYVEQIATAIDIANRYAPEHLIMQLDNARDWLPQITTAGSVFLGKWSPESVGDYATGTNHVLPTSGAAKSFSGLGVRDFMRSMSVQQLSQQGLAAIADTVMRLASLEGLEAHKRAVSQRLIEEKFDV